MTATYLITGGTRGIGLAVASRLAAGGARLLLGYRSRDRDAREAELLLRGLGSGESHLIKADLASRSGVESLIGAVNALTGRLDGLVLNAASYERRELNQMDERALRSTLYENVSSSILICQRLEAPLRRGMGRVVTVASTLGLSGYGRSSHYAAAKGGLIAATKSLARELAPGILVNCVAPGLVATERLQGEPADVRAERIRQIPLGRLAEPREVAAAVEFLLSPGASYMTGTVLNVSGGLYM